MISFKNEETSGVLGIGIHAVTELLSCGALKNRTFIRQGSGKGAAVVYQWTELGLRMMLSIGAINQDRQKELTAQIASVPKTGIPPQELMDFPKSEIVPVETKVEIHQEMEKKE